jgi:hypothetical protein
VRSRTVGWILLMLSSGLLLAQLFGPAECLLGKTWGYNGDTIWVYDGCSGEFLLGQLATSPTPSPTPAPEPQVPKPIETWGAIESQVDIFLTGEVLNR